MKITGSQFQQVLKTYHKNRLQKSVGSESVKASDKVNLSSQAKEMGRIKEILSQTPEIRAEKVAQLQVAIQQGIYEVQGSQIAERMVERHLVDKIVR